MKAEVRQYRESDREPCRSLWRELAEWHREIYKDSTIGGDHPEDCFDKHLSTVGPEKLWVAVCSSKVIGFVGLIVIGEEAEIEPIVVNKSFRNKGVGAQLIETVVSKAKELKLRHLSVLPVARNIRAIDFYYELGFTNIGKVEMFIDLTNHQWKSGLKLHDKDFNY